MAVIHALMVGPAKSHAPRKRRGRPAKRAAADIDARILSAAWTAFQTSGYQQTTMDGVAECAGVTRMTVYLRHPTKIALLRATIAARIAGWSAISSLRDWDAGDTLEEQLVHIGRKILIWSSNDEVAAVRRLMEDTTGAAADAMREMEFAIREPIVAHLTGAITRSTDANDMSVDDPREIALLFMGMLEGVWRAAPDAPGEVRLEKVTKIVAILLRGRAAW